MIDYQAKLFMNENFTEADFESLLMNFLKQVFPDEKLRSVPFGEVYQKKSGNFLKTVNAMKAGNMAGMLYQCVNISNDLIAIDIFYQENENSISVISGKASDKIEIEDRHIPSVVMDIIRTGKVKDDMGLPVTDLPLEASSQDIGVLKTIFSGEKTAVLPVVFSDALQEFGFSPAELAKKLSGTAHVVIGSKIRDKIRSLFPDIFTDSTAAIVSFGGTNYQIMNGSDIQYAAEDISFKIQKRRYFKSFQEALPEMLRYQASFSSGSGISEYETELSEKNKEIEMCYQEIDKNDKEIADLKKELDSVKAERDTYQNNFKSSEEGDPVIYYGEESDIIPGEIRDYVLQCVSDSLKNVQKGTRKYDILSDILEKNKYEAVHQKNAEMIKAAFNGYRSMDGKIKAVLSDAGIKIASDARHYKLMLGDDTRYMVSVSKTPSEASSGMNAALEISRIFM